jgi:hypothetical protein
VAGYICHSGPNGLLTTSTGFRDATALMQAGKVIKKQVKKV